MRPAVALVPLFAALVGLGVYAGTTSRPTPPPPVVGSDKPRVKLAVLVVFDQMRGDYLARWRPLFGPGGFNRLLRDGASFARCHYPYGVTTTGPGHASVLTGTSGYRHGIVNNSWYERGEEVYCGGSERYTLVPPVPKEKPAADAKPADAKEPTAEEKGAGNPDRLLSPTVADVLKAAHGDKAKVWGLSLKDRSAILPTGKRPDGAFWFTGRWTTSTYYTDARDRPVPDWVTAANKAKAPDRYFGKDWTRFRADVDYARWAGPDDAPGEGTGEKQGKTFPHPTTGGHKHPGKAYYKALANSPYGNDLLLDLTKACVRAERLGKDDAPDLLVVSFSSNDLIGHTWGPDSQEVLDVTLRSDALMADLLRFLDAEVGAGNYLLGLTADHGVCPLPEASRADGRDAGRVDPAVLRKEAEAHLRAAFGGPSPEPKAASGWVEAVEAPWLYLNPRLLDATGRSRAEVARALADFLADRPGVARAFTADELAGEAPPGDDIGRRMRRSYHPARCGDVGVVLRPFHIPSKADATGTTHGSPWGYDAHVPLLVYGPGVRGGERAEPVTPQALAAVFAQFLGVRPPTDAEAPVPAKLFR
ncbi:MAG: alkaline phosphatase family protein [Gemmataceae bacterium]|nr:alkaline phosphatase family protein [Gemmataceae bacterium]